MGKENWGDCLIFTCEEDKEADILNYQFQKSTAVDKARTDLFIQFMKEFDAIRGMLAALPGEGGLVERPAGRRSQSFAQLYVPGNDVPKMSPLVEEAFSDKSFAKLKMTPHTFQCYLRLWRVININPPKEVHFPLPPLAQIIPLLVSYWNVLKDGGDTITKLDDICQERIGIT